METATAERPATASGGVAPDTETKGAFAVRCNVSPGRVSQWIAEGKIKTASLDGKGRAARIRITAALADLGRTLDVSQRLGLNGMGTRLAATAEPAQTTAPTGAGGGEQTASLQPPSKVDDIAEQIAREKLEHARHETRKRQREEALTLGRYMLTEDAEAQIGRTAALVLTTVESGFNQMADEMAAEFGIPRRDLLHAMTKSFRSVREAASRGFAERARAIDEAARREAEASDDEDGE